MKNIPGTELVDFKDPSKIMKNRYVSARKTTRVRHMTMREFSQVDMRPNIESWHNDGVPNKEKLRTVQQVRDCLLRGWTHGGNLMREKTRRLNVERPRGKITFNTNSDEGETVDIESWFQKDFDHLFYNPTEMDFNLPEEIHIAFAAGLHAGQNAEHAIAHASTGVVVAKLLEDAGYTVRASVILMSLDAFEGERHNFAAILHLGNSPSISHLAATLHPCIFRKPFIDMINAYGDAGWGCGYPLTNYDFDFEPILDTFIPGAIGINPGKIGDNPGIVARRILANLGLLEDSEF